MQLQSRKKWTVNGTSRIGPAQETLDKVIPISRRIGVTRLADITDMDVLRIPNYSAVLPGTEDYIWVYSGKGPTKEHTMHSGQSDRVLVVGLVATGQVAGFDEHRPPVILSRIAGGGNKLPEGENGFGAGSK